MISRLGAEDRSTLLKNWEYRIHMLAKNISSNCSHPYNLVCVYTPMKKWNFHLFDINLSISSSGQVLAGQEDEKQLHTVVHPLLLGTLKGSEMMKGKIGMVCYVRKINIHIGWSR